MNKTLTFIISLALMAIIISCGNSGKKGKQPASNQVIEKTDFGTMPDGSKAFLFTLKNSNGLMAKITNYGGIVTSLVVPDKEGNFKDIVLGFDSLSGYTNDEYVNSIPFFGALIGRYGNRIGKAMFSIDGVEHNLDVNNGVNHLHGGKKGFHAVVWEAGENESTEGPSLKLSYLSKDGEMGYPGNCKVTAIYTLTNNNGLKVEFEAVTDKPTVINLTQHSYFNLTGMEEEILSHKLMIAADSFTPVDEGLIPTGEITPVEGTALDFRAPKEIGKDIETFDNGYDHNFVLNDKSDEFKEIALVKEEKSGRILKVFSTEPGVQFYSGGFLGGSITGKDGIVYKRFFGFCLEPQHYPDSPNKARFPSTVLRPGEKYSHVMEFRFEIEK